MMHIGVFATWQEKSAKTKLFSNFANDDAHRRLQLRSDSRRSLTFSGLSSLPQSSAFTDVRIRVCWNNTSPTPPAPPAPTTPTTPTPTPTPTPCHKTITTTTTTTTTTTGTTTTTTTYKKCVIVMHETAVYSSIVAAWVPNTLPVSDRQREQRLKDKWDIG